jgi:hypothetical protein
MAPPAPVTSASSPASENSSGAHALASQLKIDGRFAKLWTGTLHPPDRLGRNLNPLALDRSPDGLGCQVGEQDEPGVQGEGIQAIGIRRGAWDDVPGIGQVAKYPVHRERLAGPGGKSAGWGEPSARSTRPSHPVAR